MKGGGWICVMLVVAMVHMMVEQGNAAVTCGQVASNLGKCNQFLTGVAKAPTPECCAGVKAIQDNVPTVQERRQACDCIKNLAVNYKNLQQAAASALPGLCKVKVNVPISMKVNCKTIP